MNETCRCGHAHEIHGTQGCVGSPVGCLYGVASPCPCLHFVPDFLTKAQLLVSELSGYRRLRGVLP